MLALIKRLLAFAVAVQVAADVLGLVVVPIPVDSDPKRTILTVVLGLTLAWDIGAILALILVPNRPPNFNIGDPTRRRTIYVSALVGALTVGALALLWVTMGLGGTAILVLVGLLLILVTIGDMVSSYLVLA